MSHICVPDHAGGNSFTFMICCISPADTNFEETMSCESHSGTEER